MKKRFHVVVTENRFVHYQIEKELLSEIGAELEIFDCKSREEILHATEYADAVLLNLQQIDSEIINNMKRCKIISRYGIGVDNVDIKAAKAKGVLVSNVPDYGAEVSVSEHAISLLFSCMRKLPLIDRSIRSGIWDMSIYRPLHTINGKKLGIVGFGKIGQQVAKKMSVFGLEEILVYDPFIDIEKSKDFNITITESLDVLLKESDIITIHSPLNENTKYLIDRHEINQMKDGVVLINTARGGIVRESALVEGLEQGKIAGAGIDTLEKEPLEMTNPLLRFPNVLITNHVGFYTEETLSTLREKAVKNVCRVLSGESATNIVSG